VKINIHFWSYLAQFFLKWKLFQIKVIDKIKKHILCSVTFFENRAVYEITWKKYCRAGQATDNNNARSITCWIPKTTNHKFRLCFSTETFVEGTRLKVTLYVHCLSCLYISWPNSHSEDVGANSIKMGLDEWDMKNNTAFFYSIPTMDQCQASMNAVRNFSIP